MPLLSSEDESSLISSLEMLSLLAILFQRSKLEFSKQISASESVAGFKLTYDESTELLMVELARIGPGNVVRTLFCLILIELKSNRFKEVYYF